MNNYEVKTPLHGFRRADGDRQPIGAGEVVRLPSTFAIEALLTSGAIEPTDADESCPIDWEIAAFSMAMRGDVPPGPKLRDTGFALVASDDRHGLVAAISELGGVVFFVGEGLPDNAELALVDFSNEQLLAELDVRRAEGRLSQSVDYTDSTSVEALKPDNKIAPPASEIIPPKQDGAEGTASKGESARDADPAIVAPAPVATPPRKKVAGK